MHHGSLAIKDHQAVVQLVTTKDRRACQDVHPKPSRHPAHGCQGAGDLGGLQPREIVGIARGCTLGQQHGIGTATGGLTQQVFDLRQILVNRWGELHLHGSHP